MGRAAIAACADAEDVGGRPDGIRYRALPHEKAAELWMTFPCGQTAKLQEFASGSVAPVAPCRNLPSWDCFENRLPEVAGMPTRSDVFFAMPEAYTGGSGQWTVYGVDFTATSGSSRGDDDIVVITARRVEGEVVPLRQEFIFSAEHGLLSALVFDERIPGIQAYVLAQRTGLFAGRNRK